MRVGLAGAGRTRPPRFRLQYYRLGLAAAAGIVLAIGLWATRWEYAPPPTPPIDRPTAPNTIGGGDRARVEKEPRAQAGAPAQAEADESLRALGYIGNESQPKDDAAPSATGRKRMEAAARPSGARAPAIAGEVREREPNEKRQAKPASEPASPTAGFAPAAAGVAEAHGSRQDVLEDHKRVARAQAEASPVAPRSVATGRPGQVLLLESTGYRVSAHQDGTMVLSTEGYTCAVRQDGPSVDPDITALFAVAASAGEAAGSPAPERRGATVVRLLKPRSLEEESAGEAPGSDLPGAQGVAIETGLRTLLRDKYLPLMERRCGTVPRIVRSP